MRDALEGVEERRRALARDLADVTFERLPVRGGGARPARAHASLGAAAHADFALGSDSRAGAGGGHSRAPRRRRMESYYRRKRWGGGPGRSATCLGLPDVGVLARESTDQPGLDKYVKDEFGGEAGVEARFKELVRLLDEQIAAEEAAFAEEMQAQERQVRDRAGLVPGAGGEDAGDAAAAGNGARPRDRPQGENSADPAQGTCPTARGGRRASRG